jgi:hypothetical protein
MDPLAVDLDARIDSRTAGEARGEKSWTEGRATAHHSLTEERNEATDGLQAMVTVFYGGRSFLTSTDMAGIFLEKALHILHEGQSELVPLSYAGGVELLLISPHAQFSLGPAPHSAPVRRSSR